MIYFIAIILWFACGVMWRMGGAANFDKLWRRVGSAVCLVSLIPLMNHHVEFHWYLLSCGLVAWGCTSYFGWINYIVDPIRRKLNKQPLDLEREYWWNFAVENMVIQSSVLPFKHSPLNVGWVIVSGFVIAFVKVWIDSPYDWFQDDIGDRNADLDQAVLSEFWHGSANALCIFINMLLP
jgi:hypothetical protein